MLNFSYITKFLCSAALLCCCGGCLNEDPKGLLDENQAYQSAQDIYTNAVANLYNYIGGNADSQGLQGTYRGVYDYNTFTTDEAIIPKRGGDWYDGGFWQDLYLHRYTPDDDAIYDTWTYLFKVVMLANQSLQTIQNKPTVLSPSQQTAFSAEVRAIRALMYYELLDLFGRVPLVTNTSTPLSEVTQVPRSTLWRWLYRELQQVAPLLPTAHSNLLGEHYGHITRPVAHFLLARLALNAEIYGDDNWTDQTYLQGASVRLNVGDKEMNAWEATEAWVDSLTAAGYQLSTNYASNFAVNNENSVENIFCIPADRTLYLNVFKNLFRSRHYNHGAAYGMDSENGACATLSTVTAYGYGTDEVDARWHNNFFAGQVTVDGQTVKLDNGQPLYYEPTAVAMDLTSSPYEKTGGARMWKYEVDRKAYSDGQLQNNDIVLFRYADALLMKAEARLRQGKDGSPWLNAVRARVGMPVRQATLTNVLQERLLELMWEGCRRPDLVRFRLYHKSYDLRPQLPDEETAYTTVLPIPAKAINLNPHLTQNEGYKR